MMPYALMAFGYFLGVPAASFPSACILTWTRRASFTLDNGQVEKCRQACYSAHAQCVRVALAERPAAAMCWQGMTRSSTWHNEHICTAGVAQREQCADTSLYITRDKHHAHTANDARGLLDAALKHYRMPGVGQAGGCTTGAALQTVLVVDAMAFGVVQGQTRKGKQASRLEQR